MSPRCSAQQHRDRLAEARDRRDPAAAARECRVLDELYTAESFRRSDDRELRQLRRVARWDEPPPPRHAEYDDLPPEDADDGPLEALRAVWRFLYSLDLLPPTVAAVLRRAADQVGR